MLKHHDDRILEDCKRQIRDRFPEEQYSLSSQFLQKEQSKIFLFQTRDITILQYILLFLIIQSLAHPARFTLVTVPTPGPAVPQQLLHHCFGRLLPWHLAFLADSALSLVSLSFGRRYYTFF